MDLNRKTISGVEYVKDTNGYFVAVMPATVADSVYMDFDNEIKINDRVNEVFEGSYKYKGTVNTVSDLPSEGLRTGDMYKVKTGGVIPGRIGAKLISTSLTSSNKKRVIPVTELSVGGVKVSTDQTPETHYAIPVTFSSAELYVEEDGYRSYVCNFNIINTDIDTSYLTSNNVELNLYMAQGDNYTIKEQLTTVTVTVIGDKMQFELWTDYTDDIDTVISKLVARCGDVTHIQKSESISDSTKGVAITVVDKTNIDTSAIEFDIKFAEDIVNGYNLSVGDFVPINLYDSSGTSLGLHEGILTNANDIEITLLFTIGELHYDLSTVKYFQLTDYVTPNGDTTETALGEYVKPFIFTINGGSELNSVTHNNGLEIYTTTLSRLFDTNDTDIRFDMYADIVSDLQGNVISVSINFTTNDYDLFEALSKHSKLCVQESGKLYSYNAAGTTYTLTEISVPDNSSVIWSEVDGWLLNPSFDTSSTYYYFKTETYDRSTIDNKFENAYDSSVLNLRINAYTKTDIDNMINELK